MTDIVLSPRATRAERLQALQAIQDQLVQCSQTLTDAIQERNLYFRVSLLGACNLRCPFCHNEGAPVSGVAKVAYVEAAMEAALAVGFRRVQFTGGEPLLHPLVGQFIAIGRLFFSDVGITTNGTHIAACLQDLVDNGISRIHLSLQAEELQRWGSRGSWGIPGWLEPLLTLSSTATFQLRLNMPIPASDLESAFSLIRQLSIFGCDIRVFSILPEGDAATGEYPLVLLRAAVDQENHRRSQHRQAGTIELRDYRAPAGLRCRTCADFSRCKEQSHSLRLGADRVLRPCLATRRWDSVLDPTTDLFPQIREAALLALDYAW